MQKAKSLDSTIDFEKSCKECGNNGVIYKKEVCYNCYFGFEKKKEEEEEDLQK
jgi:ribosomal protein L37E